MLPVRGPHFGTKKTFGPVSVGGTEATFGSPGIVILNEQAYLVENHFYGGTVRVFKTDDPVTPEEVPQDPQGYVTGRPVDLAGEDTTLVVASGAPARSVPSNLYVFDVSQPKATNWVGVASLTNSATEGFVSRIAVKNGVAYAATYKKGIQVVDLQSVRAGFKACCDTEYFRMVQTLNTDGQGFGQENVISIPVDGPSGPARLEDLKAGDFVLDGQSQTLVVAVGDPGLVIVNPQTQQTVYKGSVEVIRTVNNQPQVVAKLMWAQAVALGRLSDRDVAIVAGSGTPGTMLIVVDLSNPRDPKGLGFVSLAELPADILLKDGQALLGNASSVTVVGLADPMQPRVIGTLPNVGGRLALTDAGLLLSTARSVFGGETPLGGVRTATLGVIGAIPRPKPALSRPVAVATGAPTEEETVSDIPIQLRVYPADTDIATAQLQLFNDDVPASSPIGVAMNAGAGLFNLAKGFKRKIDGATTAIMRFFTGDGSEVKSPARRIDIGRIILRVDSNNDTIVAEGGTEDDAADEQAAREQSAFAFWQADPTLDRVDRQDGLVDFATISVRLRAPLDPDQRVALRLRNTAWEVHRKVTRKDFQALVPEPPPDCVKEGKLHLCNALAADFQVNTINAATDPIFVPTPRGGGVIEIPYRLLLHDENEFLFRVNPSDDGLPMGPPGAIEVGQLLPSGEFSRLSEANVEVKRFQGLTSIVTLRRSSQPSTDPFSDHFKIASAAREEPGWESVPSDAKQVTLIVHGYAVPHQEFTTGSGTAPSEFQVKAKRLYWARHPILEAQDHARVIGVSWPGDLPIETDPVLSALALNLLSRSRVRLYYPEDEFNALIGGVPLADFIDGLRHGPGERKVDIFAHSLGNMLVSSALQQLVTNGSSGALINYVMNDAAVPSEAYLDQYDPLTARDTTPGVRDLVDHAQTLGFPSPENGRPLADVIWFQQQDDILSRVRDYHCPVEGSFTVPPPPHFCGQISEPESVPECASDRCVPVERFYRGAAALPDTLQDDVSFTTRWGKAQLNNDNTLQGAWTNLFSAIVKPAAQSSGIRVFNTYSTTDHVLRIDRQHLSTDGLHAWKASQILAKPFGAVSEAVGNGINDLIGRGGASDPPKLQKWWTLEIDGRPSTWQTTVYGASQQNAVWGGESHEAQARRWAELALWFPGMSFPAGAAPITSPSTTLGQDLFAINLYDLPHQGRNVDFTALGGDRGMDYQTNSTPSHSYLLVSKYSQVWKGYRVLRGLFKQ